MDEKKPRKTIKDISPVKTKVQEQKPEVRRNNFNEVAYVYTEEEALREAVRCMQCKKPTCIKGCPVEIDIPAFIQKIVDKDYVGSLKILKSFQPLPAVCGRVCPQENQCEATCILSRKIESVGIGRLERFAADWCMERDIDVTPERKPSNGYRVATVGSGPACIACAGTLALEGYDVEMFEAFQVPGGVLKYGIPDFRLPNPIIDKEINALKDIGVKIHVNMVIGKIHTIPQLMEEKGFDAVFIGTGAGFPRFMGIEGESLNGVLSSNEFLTRINLMQGYKFPEYDTPVGMGKNVCVIGAGNTAMDASRCALRLGAENSHIVYRRSKVESPARIEELHHAIEEGVQFKWLTAPVKIFGDDDGWVKEIECIEMELGEPDDSGRRRPIPKEGSNFRIKCDTMIYAIGTQSNPIIAQTTPGLKINKWGYIEVDEETEMTNIPGVFAGGDIVTGAATVILAMGAGKVAARGIMKYIKEKNK